MNAYILIGMEFEYLIRWTWSTCMSYFHTKSKVNPTIFTMDKKESTLQNLKIIELALPFFSRVTSKAPLLVVSFAASFTRLLTTS